jgi:hypothetical protein
MAKTRALKFFLTAKNDNDAEIAQSKVLTLLNDSGTIISNDYATLESTDNIGNYSFSIVSDQALLEFFPTDGKINDYSYGYVYYDTKKFIEEYDSIDVNDSVSIGSTYSFIPVSSVPQETTIFTLPEKFSSSKLIVETTGQDDTFEFIELNITSINDNIYTTEYGRLNVNLNPLNGIGQYSYSKENGDIKVKFTPLNNSQEHYCNVVAVSLATTEYSSDGEVQLKYANLSSNRVSIAASDAPDITTIISHSLDYQSAYYIVQINDITNNRIDFSEIFTLNTPTQSFGVQYGRVTSAEDLGEFEINTSGTFEVFFTPIKNIDVEVLVFQQALGFTEFKNSPGLIDFKNSQLVNAISKVGVNDKNNNRTNFELTYKTIPIFERAFDARDPFNVRLEENSIYLPKHFFVTGEKVLYRSQQFDRTSTEKSIGIAATFVSGIGVTDKLPSVAYVYKFDNSRIGLCTSPAAAYSTPPGLFNLTTLGIDNLHYITATDQNKKALIAIDNVIQAPIVETKIKSTLIKNVSVTDTTLVFSGISSFFSGDLIRINDEIMKIDAVGVGSTTNVDVKRTWLGTGISSHFSGDLVTKLIGNYNIIDNVLHFSEAPYGPFPPEPEFENSESTSIETLIKSTFQGRVFVRSGDPITNEEAYERNYLFDDISDSFDAKRKVFTLTESLASLAGVSNNKPIVLINNVFQNPDDDFTFNELGASSEIRFTGTATSIAYDPNNANIPRGGIIVSVGSSAGLGYQPLVCAGGTAVVSTSGTIQSVSIGNSGSGYRKDLQLVRVGVQTFDSYSVNIQFIGTATVLNGNIVGVSITNPGIGYTNYPLVYTTNTSETIPIASTEIFLSDVSKVPPLNGIISIGSILNDVPIVGISKTSVFVSTSNAPLSIISSGSNVSVKEFDPPEVIFDDPLSYSDISLEYYGTVGLGTEAKIDVVVGQGSSVIDFRISNFGYSYDINQLLTLPINGIVGIPTTSSYKPFLISVNRTAVDSFYGWTVGSLRLLDDISFLFNNRRRAFPLVYEGNRFAILAKPGSNIDIQSVLLVFVNDILQEPGVSYTFNGGSTITFSEPLKRYPNGQTDKLKIIFYRGTEGIDVIDVDILETIKIGDNVRIESETEIYKQDTRLVEDIPTVDVVETNVYRGKGIFNNPDFLRPVNWTKQRNDSFIDGKPVTKDRPVYEPLLFPTTSIIQSVGIASTSIFVDNVKTLFDDRKENNTGQSANAIEIISKTNISRAIATSQINALGEITSLTLVSSGNGYKTVPQVYVQRPQNISIGIGSTAIVTANISNGKVTSFNILSSGSGYTSRPAVIIAPPTVESEVVTQVNYSGDFGIISGIKTTSIGAAQTGLVFDLLIPENSILKNPNNVDSPFTTSEIENDYYFAVKNSNIGNGLISLRKDGSIIGIGTNKIDNIYQVISVSIGQTQAYGIGLADVAKVTVSVANYNGITGLGFSNYYGDYSWGLIEFEKNNRKTPKSFEVDLNYGIVGITSSAIVRRKSPLRYFNYLT